LTSQIVGSISEQTSISKKKFSSLDDNEFLLNDYESEEDEFDIVDQTSKKRRIFNIDDELDNDSSIKTLSENAADNDDVDVDVRKVQKTQSLIS
jgi:hypothetical protein